jgi:hypothetical protein
MGSCFSLCSCTWDRVGAVLKSSALLQLPVITINSPLQNKQCITRVHSQTVLIALIGRLAAGSVVIADVHAAGGRDDDVSLYGAGGSHSD